MEPSVAGGEAVTRAPIADHLPVLDAGRAQLCFEGITWSGAQRIVGVGCRPARRLVWPVTEGFGREPTWKLTTALQVRAHRCQFGTTRATKRPERSRWPPSMPAIDLRAMPRGPARAGDRARRLRRLIAQRREQGRAPPGGRGCRRSPNRSAARERSEPGANNAGRPCMVREPQPRGRPSTRAAAPLLSVIGRNHAAVPAQSDYGMSRQHRGCVRRRLDTSSWRRREAWPCGGEGVRGTGSIARGQRSRKLQPEGGSRASGTLPDLARERAHWSASGTGTAATSA